MLHNLNCDKMGVDQFSGKIRKEVHVQNEKLESFGYIFVIDITGLASVTLTWWAPKATFLGEMAQNNRQYMVRGHSRSPPPVCDFRLLSNTNFYPITHRFQDIVEYWSNFCS